MSRKKNLVEMITRAKEENTPITGFNTLLMTDIALSLATIADWMTDADEEDENGEATHSVNDLKWRVIDKEPPVPVSWIEKEIEYLANQDNEFAGLAASNISGMLNKWRDEQNG